MATVMRNRVSVAAPTLSATYSTAPKGEIPLELTLVKPTMELPAQSLAILDLPLIDQAGLRLSFDGILLRRSADGTARTIHQDVEGSMLPPSTWSEVGLDLPSVFGAESLEHMFERLTVTVRQPKFAFPAIVVVTYL